MKKTLTNNHGAILASAIYVFLSSGSPQMALLPPAAEAFQMETLGSSSGQRLDDSSHKISRASTAPRLRTTSLPSTDAPKDEEDVDSIIGDIESFVESIREGEAGEHPAKSSKTQWKKKRFLMMNDVQRLVARNDPRAVRKAEQMVHRMRRQRETSGFEGRDERKLHATYQKAYNLWIHALAKSGRPDAGRRAEEVLDQMRADDIPANAYTYTAIMDAYARDRKPQRAEELLFRYLHELEGGGGSEIGGGFQMQKTSEVTCDILLNAWAQQGTLEAAERAQLILYRLEEWQNEYLRPSTISYTTVIDAWAKVGTFEGAEKAEALLRRMLKGARDKQHQIPPPDTVAFNAVIHAWATSGDQDAGIKATNVIETMKEMADAKKKGKPLDVQPDIISYNTALSAWSHSGRADAAPQAEKMVQGMEKAAKSGDDNAPMPNTITYNTILHAWSKSEMQGACLRAEKILNYMLNSKRKEILPDAISFSTVMDTWAKSKEPHKAARTRKMLDQLLHTFKVTGKSNIKLSHIPFNTVLNACAFSSLGTSKEERREALQIAVSTYKEMQEEGIDSDTVTYGNMIKCLGNLMPKGDIRTRMALKVFERCCEEGLVGKLVWNEIRRVVPTSELDLTIQLKNSCSHLELRDLPRKWKHKNRFDKRGRKSKKPVRKEQQKRGPRSVRIVESLGQSGRDL